MKFKRPSTLCNVLRRRYYEDDKVVSEEYCALGWIAHELGHSCDGITADAIDFLQANLQDIEHEDWDTLVSMNDDCEEPEKRVELLETWLKEHGHELEGVEA